MSKTTPRDWRGVVHANMPAIANGTSVRVEKMDGPDLVAVCTLREAVSIDFKRRGFVRGWSYTGKLSSTATYTGKGWECRLVVDAVTALFAGLVGELRPASTPAGKSPSAAEAVAMLRSRMLGADVPHDIGGAICALIDHALQLEQALDIISSATASALANLPPNAVLRVRR